MNMTLMGLSLRVNDVKAILRRFKPSLTSLIRGEIMQAAAQLTISNPTMASVDASPISGRIGTLMARVFGCRHAEMSRPFSRDGRAYRSCLSCGAQRQFNLGNWEMTGSFYYGQPQTHQIPTVY